MAGNGSFEWNGDGALRAIQTELGKRLAACAITVQNHAKQLLSVEGTGVHKAEHDHHANAPQRRAAGKRAKRAKKFAKVAKRVGTKAKRVKSTARKIAKKLSRPRARRRRRTP